MEDKLKKVAKRKGYKRQTIKAHGDETYRNSLRFRNLDKEAKIINNCNIPNSKMVIKFCSSLIDDTFRLHDLGKVKINFQYKIGETKQRTINYNSRHSDFGACIFFNEYKNKALELSISSIDKIKIINFISALSFAISKHHLRSIDVTIASKKQIEYQFHEFIKLLQKNCNDFNVEKSNSLYPIDVKELIEYILPILKKADGIASEKFGGVNNEGLGNHN